MTSIEDIKRTHPPELVYQAVSKLLVGWCVICAETGETIPLNQLKYWNVELQACYKNAEAALAAHEKRNLEKKNESD